MRHTKTLIQYALCGLCAALLAACGGQVESDNLISTTQSQFYAKMTEVAAPGASSANAAQIAPTAEMAQAAGTNAVEPAAVEPIPAAEIPPDEGSSNASASTGSPSSAPQS